ncbi:restriction endonuclease subunit S [Flavobacterium galactosidilyticum]|uniref:restriction endonuclease subunit S n=1 Tax=Flavobacterium galactosidilyticum TaxID=2893886 RepID=UPI001E4B602D|nr:restriction endonuclease subunit S [Flavobacterium sp. F-340]UFH46900.1 restriction endonuclease subunit S [Flavobacterium sp. F-340]
MPHNWKTYKLGEIADVQNGYAFKANELVGEGIPVIKIKNIISPNVTIEDVSYFNGNLTTQLEKYIAKQGDFLISMTGSTVNVMSSAVGKMGRYRLNDVSLINQRVGKIYVTVPDVVSFDYLCQYLNRYEIHYNLALNATGSANQANISPVQIKNIDILLPSLEEQQAIASILSDIDDKIENNLAINKTLEEMAMALYKHWFVDFGPFQDGEFIESELGMIPEGWKVKKIGDIVTVIGGYAFKSKWFQETGIKVLKIKNINNNIVDISKCDCISEVVSKTINKKFNVTKGDYLVAMTGAEVGKVGVVPNYSQDLWLNQRVGKFNDKVIKNASILIGKIMQTNDFYKIIQGLAYGSAQPNISSSDIENINIILPNDNNVLDVLINDFVHLHDITTENLTENLTLTQLRDTLLPKLISGEVQLKEFQEQLATII